MADTRIKTRKNGNESQHEGKVGAKNELVMLVNVKTRAQNERDK